MPRKGRKLTGAALAAARRNIRKARAALGRPRFRLRRRSSPRRGGIGPMPRRRFRRTRRFLGRGRRFARRHPKLSTRIANGIGLLIAFNQEIGSATRDFQTGTWSAAPQTGLSNLMAVATGYNPTTGQFSAQQLTTSAASKIGGFVIAKLLKVFLKRMRVM